MKSCASSSRGKYWERRGDMSETDLLISRVGHLGSIRLNRPKALNSLTLGMVRDFTRALDEFGSDAGVYAVLVMGEGERGLCAGGDIRALYDLPGGERNSFKAFWREEYELNARIASFPKPYVVLMDGVVMGGGVGISAHGNRRVATERTRLAMPETGIGFIPDVGGSWLLTAMAGRRVHGAFRRQRDRGGCDPPWPRGPRYRFRRSPAIPRASGGDRPSRGCRLGLVRLRARAQ